MMTFTKTTIALKSTSKFMKTTVQQYICYIFTHHKFVVQTILFENLFFASSGLKDLALPCFNLLGNWKTKMGKFKLKFNTHVLFWLHWYPCFGFLVTCPLGFKARVGCLIHIAKANVHPQDPPLVLHLPTS